MNRTASSLSENSKENQSSNTNTNNSIHLKTHEPLPVWLKIAFSIPAFSKMACLLILNVNALIFYETKGASLILISFFTALARCIELFLKPIIAFSSDSSKFKLGRRKPFMLFGCAFYSIFLVCIFSPPLLQMSSTSTSLWFGIFYCLFFMADTVCTVPYMALGPEMSIDTKERESLYLFTFAFQYIGVLITSIGPVVIQNLINKCDCSHCDMKNPNELSQCFMDCNSKCNVDSNEKSLLYMCMGIGFIFTFSISFLAITYKEKRVSFMPESGNSVIVPTLYKVLNNKPFHKMLFPYIIDTLITQILATMMPFFIKYILQPLEVCKEKNIDITSWKCSSNSWLGVTMFSFFGCSLIAVMGWNFYANFVGRNRAWESYSAGLVVMFTMFVFCDKGSMILMAVLCSLISIPGSGGYLNDVILTDTIDYDEFITGKRNEGAYMVFTTFIPKIVGIAAQSIPLTIMSLLGFVPSKNGVEYTQPRSVIEFIRFYLVGIPVLLSVISFYLKTQYPIDENKMHNLTKSISFQKIKIDEIRSKVNFYKIRNPIYGTEQVQIIVNTPIEKSTKYLAEHFYNEEYLKQFIDGDLKSVFKVKIVYMTIWFGVFSVFMFVLIMTFKYLQVVSLNLFPLFSLLIVTISILFFILNVIQVVVLRKYMKGEEKYSKDFMKLFLYKYQREANTEVSSQTKEKNSEDMTLADECTKMLSDCKKEN